MVALSVEFLVGETVTIQGRMMDMYRNILLDADSGTVTVKLGDVTKVDEQPMTKVQDGVFEYYYVPDETGFHEAMVTLVKSGKILKEKSYFRVVE